ncbi:alpha/beta fold hydrolase [Cupriavidus sp. LEh25]|nr:alpha/beta hydrolase [Cupriavidus sp. LEh25]MBP0625054.1 alpha/beta fold hydrolase [Cupriavidus sp. LEh25]
MDEGTGDAGDAIVLVSGLGGMSSFWNPVIGVFKDRRRVIALDHPGVGRSTLEGRPSIEGIARAVLNVMDEKEIERAHIVGHSTGSLVAQALALDSPKRVQSIVLSSGWAKPDKRFEDFFAYRKYVLAKLGGNAYDALTKLTAYPSEWYGRHLAASEPLDFDAPSRIDVGMIEARIDMLLTYSRRDELAAIKCPTLVIGAQDDYIIPFHHSLELAELIPGATLRELSGGHFAPVTRTDPWVSILDQFLATTA